jgi:Uma2 family endonuclease
MSREILVKLPPLHSGDRLDRDEFERRYQAMPQLKKAELIKGVVYVASPLRATAHGEPHVYINHWLSVYRLATPNVGVYDNPTVRLDHQNEPQPDSVLRLKQGGQSQISVDDYIVGAPELVVEIAASSAAYDLRDKFAVYQRNRVQEYMVWQTDSQILDWFCLQGGQYVPLEPDTDGILKSQQFPGLWLDRPSLLDDRFRDVLKVLQRGLESPAHQTFVG